MSCASGPPPSPPVRPHAWLSSLTRSLTQRLSGRGVQVFTDSIVAGSLWTPLGARHHDGRVAVFFSQARDELLGLNTSVAASPDSSASLAWSRVCLSTITVAAPSTSGTAEG